MRKLRLLYLGMLILSPAGLWSQTAVTSPTPQRDPGALATITEAVAAMGGQTGVVQVTTVQVSGSISPVAASSGYPSGTFTWTTEFKNPGYEFRNQLQSNSDTSVFVSGHGSPATSSNGQVKPLSAHVALAAGPVHMPLMVLVGVLLNPTLTVTQAGQAPVSGVAAIHVHISNDNDAIMQAVTPQEWYFDPTSGLPMRVEYHVPNPLNALNWLPGARDFANYQAVNGILVPFQITNWVSGSAVSVTTISSVQLNPAVTETEFDLP